MSETNEATQVLATLMRHQKHVEANLGVIASELERRGRLHDQSKLSDSELPGFVEINRIAREHGPGTDEYEAALASPCIKEHFENNSHHPEHFDRTGEMGWLDLIEMVMDWKAAADTYGQETLRGSLQYQRNRHGFTATQWWLVQQVVDFIDPEAAV